MYNLIRYKYALQDEDANNLPTQPLIPVVTQGDGVQGAPQGNAQVATVQAADDEINVSAAILALMLYIIPISLIVYGVIHLNDCPAQNLIDISFIVLGGLSMMTRFMNCPYDFRKICRRGNDVPTNMCLIWLNIIFQLAIIAFFIAICYWIFTIDPATKPEDRHLPNYCELQFYRNTFWGCVVGLAISGLILFGGCCCVCIMACVVACKEI